MIIAHKRQQQLLISKKKKPFNINNRLIEITKSNKSFEKIIIVIIISMQN
jgi:hypothetical protein